MGIPLTTPAVWTEESNNVPKYRKCRDIDLASLASFERIIVDWQV